MRRMDDAEKDDEINASFWRNPHKPRGNPPLLPPPNQQRRSSSIGDLSILILRHVGTAKIWGLQVARAIAGGLYRRNLWHAW